MDVSRIFVQHFPKLHRHAVQPGSLMVGSEGEVETVDGTLLENARGLLPGWRGLQCCPSRVDVLCGSEKHSTWPHSNS